MIEFIGAGNVRQIKSMRSYKYHIHNKCDQSRSTSDNLKKTAINLPPQARNKAYTGLNLLIFCIACVIQI